MNENNVKKRGRKKLIPDVKEEVKEVEKKKRGRKKKWETFPYTNYQVEKLETIKFTENSRNETDLDGFNTNNINFGNLCIKVHDKEKEDEEEYFKEDKNNTCDLILSSDEEDTTDYKKEIKKVYIKEEKEKEKEEEKNLKCFNCHYFFENKPFYLPVDYCQVLDRYKLFGNFCSPNCVKSYCINNKSLESKSYLVGMYYRKLFGRDFTIKPAPSIFFLKDYGGSLTIEEFRNSFYSNNRYITSCVNSKMIKIERMIT